LHFGHVPNVMAGLNVALRRLLLTHTCRRPSRRFPQRPHVTLSCGVHVIAAYPHGD